MFCDVEQLARGAVRLCRIKDKTRFEADNNGDEPGEPGVVVSALVKTVAVRTRPHRPSARRKSREKSADNSPLALRSATHRHVFPIERDIDAQCSARDPPPTRKCQASAAMV